MTQVREPAQASIDGVAALLPGSRQLARAESASPEMPDRDAEAEDEGEQLEDGTLDADELDGEPPWWDEGSDDET